MTVAARLTKKVRLSSDVAEFRFELVDGRFSGMEPGAHVDIHLGQDLIRQYSLCDWDAEGRWIVVAVKREADGRGGSKAMHALTAGDIVAIGGPRNHFALRGEQTPVLLLAGGIGATPILAMARHLVARSIDFRIVYLARSREDAALHSGFAALDLAERYRLHCDATDGLCDIEALVRGHPRDGAVYVCGPEGMLKTVLGAGERLGRANIHYERFAAAGISDDAPNRSFFIEVPSTGQVFEIGPDETILGVLRDAKFNVEFGCAEGICGSCIVNVLAGEVDHRDSVLQGDERDQNGYMCICVSRAKSDRLALDL